MDIELLEIRDFIATCGPFRSLPTRIVAALADELTISYWRRGSRWSSSAEHEGATLDIVRSGAVEVRDAGGRLLCRCGEGERVTVLPLDAAAEFVAIEDTLLYRLGAARLRALRDEHAALRDALAAPGGERLRRERGGDRPSPAFAAQDLLTTPLGDVVARAPVCLPPETRIRDVAARMNDARVTAMLLVDDDGTLIGIVTDRDLRRHVIIDGVSATRAVRDIMTASPVAAGHDTFAHDALLLMARHGIHHLPVIDGARVIGLVTASDFVERRSRSTTRLAAAIHRAATIEALCAERARFDALYTSLVRTDTPVTRIGRVTSGVLDALTIRLLELASGEAAGETAREPRDRPPAAAPPTWLVTGSRARREWHVTATIAHASLLTSGNDPEERAGTDSTAAGIVHDATSADSWVRLVNEGLARFGLATVGSRSGTRLVGTHLDTNGWLAHVTRWLDEPQALPHVRAATLFDLRALHGDSAALSALREEIARVVRERPERTARLARSALEHRPPLGFFRDAVLTEDGDERETLDITEGAVRPIVDLARAFALGTDDDPLGTSARLARAVDDGALAARLGQDLDDAFEFAAAVRARHHVRRLEAGGPVTDRLKPEALNAFERHHLEDVFAIVRSAQRHLIARHAL